MVNEGGKYSPGESEAITKHAGGRKKWHQRKDQLGNTFFTQRGTSSFIAGGEGTHKKKNSFREKKIEVKDLNEGKRMQTKNERNPFFFIRGRSGSFLKDRVRGCL